MSKKNNTLEKESSDKKNKDTSKKSGKYWVKWANEHAKNSNKIDDLNSGFKKNVSQFIKALENSGATVKIKATKRSSKRAYLFHWCWKISLGKCKPSDASKLEGVNIKWDHGDINASKKGALEMVKGFGLAVPPKSKVAPSLTSNHIAGNAIDMEIFWEGEISILKNDKTKVKIKYNESTNNNTDLHEVAESYGVFKHKNDEPHWSHNGR
ncbi:hypothetical protein HHU12_26550 [Flammeovirga aprica JL-4]|uniref:Peptidoglycan-binding domain-containing protein n=1 Tax=Flammeovirga aprica JL-4 TaxID=694437 RepID=A0A7X9RZG9_9BACT|nr:hypothetical protein [Flammeovirga aprica JL-4]